MGEETCHKSEQTNQYHNADCKVCRLEVEFLCHPLQRLKIIQIIINGCYHRAVELFDVAPRPNTLIAHLQQYYFLHISYYIIYAFGEGKIDGILNTARRRG